MKLATKLGSAFSALFAVVLVVTAATVYFTTRAAIAQTVENHLDNVSNLIQRTVEISIDNNWDQIQKNLVLSEEIVESDVVVDRDTVVNLDGFDDYRLERYPVSVDSIRFGTALGETPDRIVRSLSAVIDAEVSLYRVYEDGMVAIASSISGNDRGRGHVIPNHAPVYQLVERGGTWIGRDYFSSTWYLTGYRSITVDDRIEAVLHIAVPQVDLDQLRDDIVSVDIGAGGFVYLIDLGLNVVIHPDSDVQNSNWSLEPFAREIAFTKNGRIEYEYGGQHIGVYKYVPAMTWVVVAASRTRDAYASIQLVSSLLLVIFGLATIASLMTSLVVSRQVTKPVVDITARFREIAEGDADLNRRINVTSNDEVGELAQHFNRFVHRVSQLNEVENRELALELRDAQINALQAQINPHFLYNTLETVRFMIEMQDERATLIVQHLADLFRISIGTGETFVTVEHEIRHVQLYYWIHELRYPKRLTLEVDVPPSVRKLQTLKFILQPIVENAIHHGLDGVERDGTVSVTSSEVGGDLVLSVLDNGRGIEPARLRNIVRHLTGASPTRGSIGLKNVHERLRLHFGARYGVSISSLQEGGVRVDVRLPRIADAAREERIVAAETAVQ